MIHFITLLHILTVRASACYNVDIFDYWKHVSYFIDGNWLEICHLDRYSLMIIVIKKELKLILVYVYIVFFYTWLQLVPSNYKVTYFNFLRWIIEGSFLPQTLFISFFFHVLCIEIFFETYHLLYVTTIVTKIPLFILMSYAEIQSDFFSQSVSTLTL